MPRERPEPAPFEPPWLERSLDRYLTAGLVFMVALLVGFVLYLVREPDLRADAKAEQQVAYTELGQQLYADNCASCHGDNGLGDEAPRLNAKEFLQSTSDDQTHLLISGGVSGTDMSAWGIDYGGTLTAEQVSQLVTYIRGWEPDAASVPDWRLGADAVERTTTTTAPG